MDLTSAVFLEGAYKTTIHGFAYSNGVVMIGPKCRCVAGVDDTDNILLDTQLNQGHSCFDKVPLIRGIAILLKNAYWVLEGIYRLNKLLGSNKKRSLRGFISFFLLLTLGIATAGIATVIEQSVVIISNEYISSQIQIISFKVLLRTLLAGICLLLFFYTKGGQMWNRYSGAVNVSIHYIENELELITDGDKLKKYAYVHPRNSTLYVLVSFWILMVLITIGFQINDFIFILLVIGILYELRIWIGKDQSSIARHFNKVAILMQTTYCNEPSKRDIEVALASMNEVVPIEDGIDSWMKL